MFWPLLHRVRPPRPSDQPPKLRLGSVQARDEGFQFGPLSLAFQTDVDGSWITLQNEPLKDSAYIQVGFGVFAVVC